MEPKIIEGGLAVDERGVVRFVNDFNFEGVKRFYVLENFQVGYVRAWHGHWAESKWITVMQGSAVIGVAEMIWGGKGNDVKLTYPSRFVLSDKNPKVLHVPRGYANGSMALEEGTHIIHFSDKALEEAEDDDVRIWCDRTTFPWRIDPR